MHYSLLTALCWSLTGIFIVFLADIPPLNIVWSRAVVAASALFVIMLLSPKKPPPSPKIKLLSKTFLNTHKRSIALAGLMSLYYLFSSYAFLHIPVAIVAMIIGLAPIIILIIRYCQREPIALSQAVGIGLSVLAASAFMIQGFMATDFATQNVITQDAAATTFANTNPSTEVSSPDAHWLFGGLLAGLSTVCLAVFSLGSWAVKASPRHQALNPYSSALTTCLILMVALAPAVEFDQFPSLSLFQWLQLILLGITATAMATTFNAKASEGVSPQIHATFCMSTPLMAAIFADVWLDQNLTRFQYITLAACILGIFFSIKARSPAKVHPDDGTASHAFKIRQSHHTNLNSSP